MPLRPDTITESGVPQLDFDDRWSKDLVGGPQIPTAAGFSLGVASYHAVAFGEPQVHEDQEALYVVSGEGEVQLNEQVFPVSAGTAVFVPPLTRHATRRTGPDPVKVVYTHAAL